LVSAVRKISHGLKHGSKNLINLQFLFRICFAKRKIFQSACLDLNGPAARAAIDALCEQLELPSLVDDIPMLLGDVRDGVYEILNMLHMFDECSRRGPEQDGYSVSVAAGNLRAITEARPDPA
jgi:hypothetical protein